MVKAKDDLSDITPEYYLALSIHLTKATQRLPEDSFERLMCASLGSLAMGISEILEQLQKGEDDGQ